MNTENFFTKNKNNITLSFHTKDNDKDLQKIIDYDYDNDCLLLNQHNIYFVGLTDKQLYHAERRNKINNYFWKYFKLFCKSNHQNIIDNITQWSYEFTARELFKQTIIGQNIKTLTGIKKLIKLNLILPQ